MKVKVFWNICTLVRHLSKYPIIDFFASNLNTRLEHIDHVGKISASGYSDRGSIPVCISMLCP